MSTVRRVRVSLAAPASDMAQEEIAKQVAFLASGIANVAFPDESTLEFDADEARADALAEGARALAERMQRSLRSLKRKVAYRSPAMDAPRFAGAAVVEGLSFESDGLAVLEGPALALFEYFDRCFADFGLAWKPRPMRAPTLIPASVSRAATTSAPSRTASRSRATCPRTRRAWRTSGGGTRTASRSMTGRWRTWSRRRPACRRRCATTLTLRTVTGRWASVRSSTRWWGSASATSPRTCATCAASGISPCGSWCSSATARPCSPSALGESKPFQEFLDAHQLAGEIRTASDPFFIAPDSAAKTYFQISSETKFEISLLLPGDARLAVGSFNYHGDFFGKSFHVSVPGGGPMHSVCFAWGSSRGSTASSRSTAPTRPPGPSPCRRALEPVDVPPAPTACGSSRDPTCPRRPPDGERAGRGPCWVYDETMLSYHLRRPSVDRDLLLGLEDESTGGLVAYYAFMPLAAARRERGARRAVFGSFLTAAAAAPAAGRRAGRAGATPRGGAVRGATRTTWPSARSGAVSNESIARSCASARADDPRRSPRPVPRPSVAAVARRALSASSAIRAYQPQDSNDVAAPLTTSAPVAIEAPRDRRDYDSRFGAPLARTYVLPTDHGLVAIAHFVLLTVRDGQAANLPQCLPARLRDRCARNDDSEVLLGRPQGRGGRGLHSARRCSRYGQSSPVARRARISPRPRRLNLLVTRLRPEGSAAPPPAEFLLDVF